MCSNSFERRLTENNHIIIVSINTTNNIGDKDIRASPGFMFTKELLKEMAIVSKNCCIKAPPDFPKSRQAQEKYSLRNPSKIKFHHPVNDGRLGGS